MADLSLGNWGKSKSGLQKKGRKQFDLANLDYQNNGSFRLAWKCSEKK